MAEPINYLLPQVNPLADFAQGFNVASGVRDVLQQRQVFAQQQAQAQAQAQRQAEYRQAAQQAFMTGDPGQFIALQAQFPEFSEQAQAIYKSTDAARRDVEFTNAARVVAALKSGKPEIAKEELRQRIEAAKNSGEDFEEDEEILAAIDRDAAGAASSMMFLMAQADPVKFKTLAEGLASAGKEEREAAAAPAALAKAEAEASRAATLAKYADQQERLDLAKKSEDIRASRENTRLRAIEAAFKREGNDLERQKLGLQVEEARAALNQKAADRLSEADSALAGIADSKQLIGELLQDKGRLKSAIGGLAIRGAIPGTEARAVVAQIERLQNSIAAANLDKLKGAMSDKDILFLKNISTSLDRYQDEDAFIAELQRVGKTLDQAESRISKKFGAQPAAPAAPTAPAQNVVVDY